MKIELKSAFIAKRGRGTGAGQRVEVQVLGKPEYPKDGPQIAEDFQYEDYAKVSQEDMANFAVSLGLNPCVMMAEGIDRNLMSADRRNELEAKKLGNLIITAGLATEKNYAEKVKAFKLIASSQDMTFESVVELMTLAEKMKADKKKAK